MERLELKLIYTVLALMVLFTGLVVYASVGLGIKLPTCENHVKPFKQGEVIPRENNSFEVHYLAKMWAFEPAELILPEKAEVDLYVSSLDVNHGMNIVGTDLNLMAVPGTVNAAHYRFERQGDYLVVCHEYCGLNHQNMFGKIHVVAPQVYTKMMEELAGRVKAEGEKLSAQYDCTTCHTIDGTEGLGPTFKGMYGRKEKLADGREVVIDDHYMIESIKEPDEDLVLGHDKGSMPQVAISDKEIAEIISYIKTLR